MAASSYAAALARLLAHEGGYTDDAADPGGPTNFGITIYDYRKYVKPGASAADVRAMTIKQARAIYRSKYWDAQRCDELPAGVDCAVFDYGVNSGVGRSGKVLRRVLGLADNDWHTTDEVLAALAKRNADEIITAICNERLRFLRSLKTWDVFGKGWSRRVAEVRADALALAAGGISNASGEPAPGMSSEGNGIVPVTRRAQQGSAAVIIAAGTAAAQQAHQSGARPGIVVIILIAAFAVAAAVYAFWRWWQAVRQSKPARLASQKETLMELALICLLVGSVLGAAGGYMLATHVHSVAAAASSAIVRATTIPAGDLAALNAKVDGLGNTLQTIATAVQTPALGAVNMAAASAPQD